MLYKTLLFLSTLFLVMVFGAACGLETEELKSEGSTTATPVAPAPTATASQVEETADNLEEVEAAPAVQVVDSIEDIVGKWRFRSDKFNQYFEDGTWYGARSLVELDYRIDEGGPGKGEYWFEDGLFHVTWDFCEEEGIPETGVYRIELVEGDRVKFVVVDDPCWGRMNFLTGSSGRRLSEDT